MTTQNANVFETRFGFVPCDYEHYKKLRRLQYLYLLSRKADAAHERWSRKAPQNRVERRWIRNQQGQKVKRIAVGPLAQPKGGLEMFNKRYGTSWSSPTLGEQVVADYRNAKYPKSSAVEVGQVILSAEEIFKLLEQAEAWLDHNK